MGPVDVSDDDLCAGCQRVVHTQDGRTSCPEHTNSATLDDDDTVIVCPAFVETIMSTIRLDKPAPRTVNAIKQLAISVSAIHNCTKPTANESQRAWALRHRDRIKSICKDVLPSGAGFSVPDMAPVDIRRNGTIQEITFHQTYSAPDDTGSMRSTGLTITVTACLTGMDIRVRGKCSEAIKDYVLDAWILATGQRITFDGDKAILVKD